MKRLVLLAGALAAAAAAFSAWSVAAPEREVRAQAPAKKEVRRPALPPLPADIRRRGRFRVGVKCDVPPFGYIDPDSRRNVGFDVDIARWFSRYAFGRANRVTFECAPTPSREPLLTTGRADLVISTFTYTPDRDTRIDFSRAYFKVQGRLLVPNDSPIRTVRDIAGKTIATTRGSIYDSWVRRCFPSAELIVTDGFTNALIAFRQRGQALMWDDTGLLATAQTDPNVKLATPRFLAAPYGIGIRQGNAALKRWVDSRMELMRKKDTFMRILRTHVAPQNIAFFRNSILRPRNTFGYARTDPTTVCPS
jgi:polar amino acid transport system substrate-binding protein